MRGSDTRAEMTSRKLQLHPRRTSVFPLVRKILLRATRMSKRNLKKSCLSTASYKERSYSVKEKKQAKNKISTLTQVIKDVDSKKNKSTYEYCNYLLKKSYSKQAQCIILHLIFDRQLQQIYYSTHQREPPDTLCQCLKSGMKWLKNLLLNIRRRCNFFQSTYISDD